MRAAAFGRRNGAGIFAQRTAPRAHLQTRPRSIGYCGTAPALRARRPSMGSSERQCWRGAC